MENVWALPLVYGLVFGSPALVALLVAANDRRLQRKHRAAWQAAADRLAGEVVQRDERAAPVIVADVNGVSLSIDYRAVYQASTATRVRALAPELRVAELHIGPDHRPASSGPACHELDVQVGQPEFDRELRVLCDVPARARAWLDAELRAALLSCKHWRVRLVRGEVWIERARLITDVDELEAAAHATVALVRAEARFRARWLAAMDALGATGGPQRFETVRQSTEVSLELDVGGDHVLVHVRAPLPFATDAYLEALADDAPATLRLPLALGLPGWSVHANDATATRRRLQDHVWAELLALAPRRVALDGSGVTLELRAGAEPELERLRSAVALVATLAQRSSTGPYR